MQRLLALMLLTQDQQEPETQLRGELSLKTGLLLIVQMRPQMKPSISEGVALNY